MDNCKNSGAGRVGGTGVVMKWITNAYNLMLPDATERLNTGREYYNKDAVKHMRMYLDSLDNLIVSTPKPMIYFSTELLVELGFVGIYTGSIEDGN